MGDLFIAEATVDGVSRYIPAAPLLPGSPQILDSALLLDSPLGLTLLVTLFGVLLLLVVFGFTRLFAPSVGELSADKFLLGRRRLLLQRFEGDEWGAVSEAVKQWLLPRFQRGWLIGREKPQLGFVTTVSERDSAARGFESHALDVTLQGKVSGRHLQIEFYPPSPSFQNVAESQEPVKLTDETVIYSRDVPQFVPCYAPYDFPLSRLEGLSVQLPGLQKTLLYVVVSGIMARGYGFAGLLRAGEQLRTEGARFEAALAGLEKTQPVLHQEMQVLTAWCFLITGLMRQEPGLLRRSIRLYQTLDKSFWTQRERVFWAGIKANQAMAAFALMQHERVNGQSHMGGVAGFDDVAIGDGMASGNTDAEGLGDKQSITPLQKPHSKMDKSNSAGAAPWLLLACAQEALRYFQRDNFPTSWGRLMVMLGLGAVNVPDTPCAQDGSVGDGDEALATFMGRVDRSWLERKLDGAIDYWRHNHQGSAMAEAYFAKGQLAQCKACQYEGLQDWERAENAFLGALSVAPEQAPWWSVSRADVQLALGQLYLSWGTDFGEKGLLEKAMHYLPSLIEAGGKQATAAEMMLARCYLNYGGVINEAAAHRRALDNFSSLKTRHPKGAFGDEVARGVGVARARLALIEGDVKAARQAVSEISSVLGFSPQGHLARDVLLRLRARLRELIFMLEGDDVALDRAIEDRRELVALAEMNVSDLRWAVETRDLVGLLTRRQYKGLGPPRDFHEAHFLIEKCLSVCEMAPRGAPLALDELVRRRAGDMTVQHIKATLYRQLGRLLASFARLQFDLKAMNEAVVAFEAYLKLTPREQDAEGRADVLHQIGQIHLDCSAHYGQHGGLIRAKTCYAEAFDIYLAVGKMDQANRMHRFLVTAESALLAYQPVDQEEATRKQEG